MDTRSAAEFRREVLERRRISSEFTGEDAEVSNEEGDQQNPKKKDDESRSTSLSGAWIPIGAGVGVALGVALDNIGIGIAIGVAVGVALTAAQSGKSSNK